ncbi:MAG TPA: hypothetical protein VKT82_10290 [Ktedonobacterales bacterium]|nr:hypothetical protein [Ktedonobacterales bacterium]
MSQVQFEQTASWEGAKLAHRRFMDDYNAQPHWAFRHRTDNHHSPSEVLGWPNVQRLRTREELHRIFYATRFLCRLDRLGYAHFRRWKLYGEEALARHPAVIWLHGEALTIEHAETPLAKYGVEYQPDKKHFKAIPTAQQFRRPITRFRDTYGKWMKPSGNWRHGCPTMRLANAGNWHSPTNCIFLRIRRTPLPRW